MKIWINNSGIILTPSRRWHRKTMDDTTRNKINSLGANGLALVVRILNAVFSPPHDLFSRIVAGGWLAGLVLAGIVIWGLFFSWGDIPFDFHDWAEVTGPRYALLADAVDQGVLPLHADNTTALRGVTDRYFSIPDTPFSPQYLLLRYLEPGQYIFLDTLLFYLIGTAGLLLIFRKYRLSPFVFTILFLLFHFNGNVVNHLAVGHSIWVGHFLLPYFVLLVLHLVERQTAGWKWVLGMSLLFVVVMMQGYFHLYIWSLIFLGVLALFNWRLVKPILLAAVFSILTSLWRLLPPSLILEGISHEYLGGFASASHILTSLMVLHDPDRAFMISSIIFPLAWWEVNYFIGLLGFAVLVIFGLILPLKHSRLKDSLQVQILVPSLVLAVLSIGRIYFFLTRLLPVPPFTGERVTARFLILPLVFLMVLAAIFMQRTLSRNHLKPWHQILGFLLAAVLLHDLVNNIFAWRIRFLDGLLYLFPKMPFEPAQHTIANHADPVYFVMLSGGAAVSVLAFSFLIFMSLRERKRARLLQPAAY
jgi:hypothetical protein